MDQSELLNSWGDIGALMYSYKSVLLSIITCRQLSLTYHTQKYFIKALYYLTKTWLCVTQYHYHSQKHILSVFYYVKFRSRLIYSTSARHEWDTSDTSATQVRHKRYTNNTSATWVKIFDFDSDTSKNIFLHPYIYYMASERLWEEGQFHSKNYHLEMVETSAARNFNNSWPLHLTFSNIIKLCPNIWFIKNSKCQQYFFEKGAAKKT